MIHQLPLADSNAKLVLRGLWNGFKALAVALWHGLKTTVLDVWHVRPRHLDTVYSVSYLLGMIIFVIVVIAVIRRLTDRRVLIRRRRVRA
jgi:hypothetical protein